MRPAVALIVALLLCASPAFGQCFRRGDVNGDGRLDMEDSDWLNEFLFGTGSIPCDDAADVNDDGMIMVSDSIYLLSYLTTAGPPPPSPGPCDCGPDPTADGLGCVTFNCQFIRGDADGDGVVNPTADSNFLNAFLFTGGPPPPCMDAADANDDGFLNANDSVAILTGAPLPMPFPNCGMDPTADTLSCNCYTCPAVTAPVFMRGDVDADGSLDPNDLTVLNAFLFTGGSIVCDDAADVNDDGIHDTADSVVLGLAIFNCGPIPAPSPHICGPDPTPDALGCAQPWDTCQCTGVDFVRGDCNTDNFLDIADAIMLFGMVFGFGGFSPTCLDACDANDDGCIDISDPIRVLDHLFLGGVAFPTPYPSCGYDPTPLDNLGCRIYPDCPAGP